MGTSSPHTDDDAVARLAEEVRQLRAQVGDAEARLGGQIQEVAAAVTDLIEPVDRLARVAHYRGETKTLAAAGLQQGPGDLGTDVEPPTPAEAVPGRRGWDRRGLCRMAVCVLVTGIIVTAVAYATWGRDGQQFDDRGATLAIPPTASAPPGFGAPVPPPRRGAHRGDDPEPASGLSKGPTGSDGQSQQVSGAGTGEPTPRPSSSPSSAPPPEMAVGGGDCDRRLLALRRIEVCRDQP